MASSQSAVAESNAVAVFLVDMNPAQRATCALVCCGWAKSAASVTHSIVKHGLRDLTGLQQWLDKNGRQISTMQLHVDCPVKLKLAGLPCPQLQDLLLHGLRCSSWLTLDSRVWSDIAAATKLTSVSLQRVHTDAQQADVVSALTALPDLQQLTWREVQCGQEWELFDSTLLQRLTKLTGLNLSSVSAEALQPLGSVSKLQHLCLGLGPCKRLAATGIPGLQQLTALTSLQLCDHERCYRQQGLPSAVSHLTALQQLEVFGASATELNRLQALTALTKLRVRKMTPDPTLLQLPALNHLDLACSGLRGVDNNVLHISQLSSCTQLRRLSLHLLSLVGPDSLGFSSRLQELHLHSCSLGIGGHWRHVFPSPGQLPHLTLLSLRPLFPWTRQADLERTVECCSGLRWLEIVVDAALWHSSNMSSFECLSRLTDLVSLHLGAVDDLQCSSLVQVTALQELEVTYPEYLTAAGLRHLTNLQLTTLSFPGAFNSFKVDAVLQEQLSDKIHGSGCALVNKAPPGSPPDVSARLLRACDMAADGQQQ